MSAITSNRNNINEIDLLQISLWTLSNLMRGNNTKGEIFLKHNIPYILYTILTMVFKINTNTDKYTKILYEILWCYTFLTAKNDDKDNRMLIELLVKNDILSAILINIVNNINNINEQFFIPLVRIFGNIISCENNDICLILLKHNEIYPLLMNLIEQHPIHCIIKEIRIYIYTCIFIK